MQASCGFPGGAGCAQVAPEDAEGQVAALAAESVVDLPSGGLRKREAAVRPGFEQPGRGEGGQLSRVRWAGGAGEQVEGIGSPSSQDATASRPRAPTLSAASRRGSSPGGRPGGGSPGGRPAVGFGSVMGQAPVWMYDAQMVGVAG